MKILKYGLLAFALLWLYSCEEDNNPVDSGNDLKILSVQPNQGFPGDKITITGTNFSAVKSANQVFFGGNAIAYPDTVIQGNPMSMIVRVPQGAVSGFITVKALGKSGTSPSEFTVLNDKVANLYPFESGSYWVYNYFMLDTNDKRVPGIALKDSFFVEGKTTIFGKTCSILQKFSTNPDTYVYEPKEKQYFYSENNELYTHPNFFSELLSLSGTAIQLPFKLDDKWYLIASREKFEWNILTKNFSNEPMLFGTTEGTVSGKLEIEGEYNGSEKVVVSAFTGTTFKYNIKIKFDGKVTVSQIGLNDLDLKLSRELEFYYAPDIGRVKTRMKAMKLVIPNLSDSNIPGFETELLTFFGK
jgi:hypothetical protein